MAPNAHGRLPLTPRGVTRPPRTRPLQARRRSGDRVGRPRSPVAPPPSLILRQFPRPCARLAIDAVNALDAAAFTARFDDMELRDHFDHVESFLMDRDTLMAFESLWGTEDRSIHRDLPRLTTEERARSTGSATRTAPSCAPASGTRCAMSTSGATRPRS